MVWILVVVLAIIAIFEFLASRGAYRKLNALNEYTQFLLFHPEVYKDHKTKFLPILVNNSDLKVNEQAMASYNFIENMAVTLCEHIFLANVVTRAKVAELINDGSIYEGSNIENFYMVLQEAETIVKEYGGALAKGKSGETARPISLLPCSIGRIKFAFFTYLSFLIDSKQLTKEMGNNLIFAFQSLAFFINDDDAESINKTGDKIRHKSKSITENESYFNFVQMVVSRQKEFLSEINCFINECYNKENWARDRMSYELENLYFNAHTPNTKQ